MDGRYYGGVRGFLDMPHAENAEYAENSLVMADWSYLEDELPV